MNDEPLFSIHLLTIWLGEEYLEGVVKINKFVEEVRMLDELLVLHKHHQPDSARLSMFIILGHINDVTLKSRS